jgi:pSer/pThr/pTyr-binding forkhead associated (FHA) protein
LQDLNTVNGTYINDCRIQNVAVRLAEHDSIRFGFNGILFQFIIQDQVGIHATFQTVKSLKQMKI